MSIYRYGRLPRKANRGIPALGDFLDRLEPWPDVKPWGWEWKVPASKLNILGNGEFGDCAEAGAFHLRQLWLMNNGIQYEPTTADALAWYSELTGFDPNAGPPGQNPTDNGTVLTDLLAAWKNDGMPVTQPDGTVIRDKILGAAALDIGSLAQMRYATYLAGGIYLGINCPDACEQNVQNWNFQAGFPIAGGHCVIRSGEGADGGVTGSWGLWIPTSNSFYLGYLEEAYMVVNDDWLNKISGVAPSGFNLSGLLAAMKLL